MKAGDIVLISLPQADGQMKRRPALLLKQLPGHKDWLVCGISSQVHQFIKGFDELIDSQHADFNASGLQKASVIRLNFLSTFSSQHIHGAIGSVSKPTLNRLLKNLSEYLIK